MVGFNRNFLEPVILAMPRHHAAPLAEEVLHLPLGLNGPQQSPREEVAPELQQATYGDGMGW